MWTSPHDCLGFLTAWQLDSKKAYSKCIGGSGRSVKVKSWKLFSDTYATFYQSEQVTEPAQIQEEGKQTSPLDERCGKEFVVIFNPPQHKLFLRMVLPSTLSFECPAGLLPMTWSEVGFLLSLFTPNPQSASSTGSVPHKVTLAIHSQQHLYSGQDISTICWDEFLPSSATSSDPRKASRSLRTAFNTVSESLLECPICLIAIMMLHSK